MPRKQTNIRQTILTLVCLVFFTSSTAYANDFFLRPTNLLMVEDWTPRLSFFVSNPSDRTIVLKVQTRQAGTVLASIKTEEVSLKALPADIVLRAGERKIIRLDYAAGQYQSSGHYEVVVEQLPIIYLNPGEESLPATMLVTRYVAEIKVRGRQFKKQYAMTGFGRALETGSPILASAQK